MMMLETVNNHMGAILLSLGLFKRELYYKTFILLFIQIPVAFFTLTFTTFAVRGLFYAQMSGTFVSLLLRILKILTMKWEEHSYHVFARDEISLIGQVS